MPTSPTPFISIADVRAQGLTIAQASDAAVTAAIAAAMEDIYQYTRRWFSPIVFTLGDPLVLDGTGTETLYLPVPPITTPTIYDCDTLLDAEDYIVLGKVGTMPDDRLEARVVFRSGEYGPGIPGMPSVFMRGGLQRWTRQRGAVKLVGTFGFVEADGTSPPPLLKKAALRLALREWPMLTDQRDVDLHQSGVITEESVDRGGHSYKLSGVRTSSGPTGVPEIDRILARYQFRTFGSSTAGF